MPISGKMYVWGNRAKNVSKGPGVYALYNAEKVLIYVGVGASLREKFIHYLETDFSNDPRKRDTRYYRRELTSKREDRKKELLDEYRRKHGKFARARCCISLCFLSQKAMCLDHFASACPEFSLNTCPQNRQRT